MNETNDPAGTDSPLKIALVDDDPMWRYLTGTALRERGWAIVDFESGGQLLEAAAGDPPDLVLIDAMMPVMDGFETCRRLRSVLADVPILMLTGLEDELSIRRAYEAGANDFFIKSTHWALLGERIRHLVRIADMGRQLSRSNEHLVRVHAAARTGTFDFDFASRRLCGTPGSFRVLGFQESRSELLEAEFRGILDDDEIVRLYAAVEAAYQARTGFSIDLRLARTPSGVRRIRIDGEPQVDADGRVRMMHCVVRDHTDDMQAREELERLASHDALTGLPNRSLFLSELARLIGAAGAAEQRVAVAVIDLDRFTQINETLGQLAGDDVLCEVGRRIRAILASPEQEAATPRAPMLARLPGDEFALMLPDVRSVAEVGETITRVMQEIQRPYTVADTECFVSASVGVALFPRDGDSSGILLARADRAAREVKSRGRNDVGWYAPSLQADTRGRLEIVSGLHKALERDEFELHFQPWVDVAEGRVTGLEALLRWRRDGRQVPPGEFIPAAEDTGLIVPIGEWVLQHAASLLAGWRRQGIDLDRVAINVPTVHFERESLLTVLRASMLVHRLAPQSIELELTETCMVRDFERTLPRLEALIDAGATLAIDDFGTGYSSLAYLTRLPISKLKVDRAFVSQLGVSREGGAVCRAIVALGQSLGVQVLAEGVETPAQVSALTGIGCSVMQGFLFSRPVPATQVREAIAAAESVARRLAPRETHRARLDSKEGSHR